MVLKSLRQIIRSVDLHSQKLKRSIGLTGPQLIILKELLDNGEMTPGQLSSAVNLSQATITSIIDRLENRGLVIRTRSNQDRRKVYLSLTDGGKEALSSSPTVLQYEFLEKFEALEDWEQHLIVASLQKIAKLMGAQHLPAEPVLSLNPLDSEDPTRQK